MATLIDHFELAFPVTELPLPAIERYRMVPIQSLYLEIDFEDTDERDSRGSSGCGSIDDAPQSDRYLRARCWASEE